MDGDDPYWRLSFGDEGSVDPARKSTGGLMMNPVWSDYDHEFRFPVSGFNKCPGSRNGGRNFNDMVLDIRQMKERENKQRCGVGDAREKRSEQERDIIQVESEYMVYMKDDLSKLTLYDSNDHKLEFKEIKVKAKKKKRKTKSKVNAKAYSPRTECKVRALEEMKRARMKMKMEKRKEEEQEQMAVEGKTVFDSFPVLRNSFDPQRDFRDSMVEMIRERRIRRSEDLEELLACYLDLNSEEYHGLIIKVFLRIWFDLKGRVL